MPGFLSCSASHFVTDWVSSNCFKIDYLTLSAIKLHSQLLVISRISALWAKYSHDVICSIWKGAIKTIQLSPRTKQGQKMHYFDYGEHWKKLLQPWNPVRRKSSCRQAGVTNTKANTFQLQEDVKAAKPADGIIPSKSFRVFTRELRNSVWPLEWGSCLESRAKPICLSGCLAVKQTEQ